MGNLGWNIILDAGAAPVTVCITGLVLGYLLWIGRKEQLQRQKGWWYVVSGIALLFLAGIVDTTDEFVTLNKYVIIGDTASQTVVETVWYIGGAILFLVGFLHWLPVVGALKKTEQDLTVEIEERIRAQQALKEGYDELEMRVEERTVELSKTNRILEAEIAERKRLEGQPLHMQKMEAIGTLAGGIAHDFNNLLSVVMGYCQLGMNEVSSGDPLDGYLQEIQKAAGRASDLTEQLLAFSRRQIIEPQIISLNELVVNMDRMLRRLIGEDIELATVLAPDLGLVKVDPGQIEQVLVNLAINAQDAMPNGGKLTIEVNNATKDEVYAGHYREANSREYVRLSVSDTGIGIAQDIKARIFEPFFTTKDVGRGTGLGLATCYGIVTQSGGHIEVESEPSLGSTFRIYLPRVEELAGSLPIRDDSGCLARGSETVLLVEDEPAVRGVAAQVLRKQGFTVWEAANGHEALRMAHEQLGKQIDLLLTNVIMPLMGGAELVEKFRLIHPGTRVLLTSGYIDDNFMYRGILERDAEFMRKPFTPAGLTRRVRQVFDQ